MAASHLHHRLDAQNFAPVAPSPTGQLAAFASGLRFTDIPESVVRRSEDLLVDWLGSAVAGHSSPAVHAITSFAHAMGPQIGPSQVIVDRTRTSPYLAAMVNAASSNTVEQGDVHNGAVFHPGTVVFPAAVAVAQALGASGQQLLTASVAGYEVGIRVGEFLGRSHYKFFHTTGTAGTLAAAAAVGNLLGLDKTQMQHAFGSAGTQSAGLWEFLRTAADSKQLHTAHASAAGLMSAYLAKDGFTGAAQILEGPQGMAAGMSTDANPAKLTDGLGTRWATAETSFKYHAACRHTHPAADALLHVMQVYQLKAEDLARVVTHVHQGAIDLLSSQVDPSTVYQAQFSMGTVLALVARFGHAGLAEFEQHFLDESTRVICQRIEMVFDEEVEAAYPRRWTGKVTVHTTDGRTLRGRVDEPKGDPGNSLSREEITVKVLRQAAFSGGATRAEMQAAVASLWSIASWPRVTALLSDH
jgi:2-methylcitrate dehydratase PrpD